MDRDTIKPEKFELVPRDPSSRWTNASLWTEPGIQVPANPLPNSNPFVAGMLSIAWASTASNLSRSIRKGNTYQKSVLQVQQDSF